MLSTYAFDAQWGKDGRAHCMTTRVRGQRLAFLTQARAEADAAAAKAEARVAAERHRGQVRGLEGELSARKAQVLELRSDLQVTAPSPPSSNPSVKTLARQDGTAWRPAISMQGAFGCMSETGSCAGSGQHTSVVYRLRGQPAKDAAALPINSPQWQFVHSFLILLRMSVPQAAQADAEAQAAALQRAEAARDGAEAKLREERAREGSFHQQHQARGCPA